MTIRCLTALCLLAFSTQVAADVSKGKQLHDKNCIACHINISGGDGTALYTRTNHRVTHLNALKAQVRRCESNLELRWFEEDIDAVVDYLNTTYYKFGRNP